MRSWPPPGPQPRIRGSTLGAARAIDALGEQMVERAGSEPEESVGANEQSRLVAMIGAARSLALLWIPLMLATGWQARQTNPDTFKLLDQLLHDHTDAEAAQQLNAAGRRTGTNKPFTAHIVMHIRRANDLASHADRLRARGLLTIDETAQRLGVHTSTIKAWHRAGLLTSHKANDRNERLFDAPDPDDPRLQRRMGCPLRDRELTSPSRQGAL